MKGIILFTVLFLSCYQIATTQTLQAGQQCTINGAITANPSDNTQFFFCAGGIVYLGGCSGGQIYDATMQNCVTSTSTGSVNCANNNYATYPFPNDSTKYYYCWNNQALVVQCPIGSYYQSTSGSCGTGSGGGGVTGVTCPANTNTMYPDPNGNCQNYVLCLNGVASAQTCPTGYYFQPSSFACSTTVPANCNGGNGGSGGTCSQQGQLQAVSGNCFVYNYCTNGSWQTISCPPNYYFSPITLNCNPTKPATC